MASTALSYIYPEQMAQCLEDTVAFLKFNPFFYIPYVDVHVTWLNRGKKTRVRKWSALQFNWPAWPTYL